MQTRASLLIRIRDPKDDRAWGEFVRLYAPLLHSYAMKNRLQDADAADLAQDTLRLVLRAAPQFVYDPQKGTFRGWLFTIARNEIRKFVTRKAHVNRGTGDTDVKRMLDEMPAVEPSEAEWDREFLVHQFHSAAKRIKGEFREATWEAFWRSIVLGEPCETVANELGISLGAVYISRSRVAARIRNEIETVSGSDQ